MRCDFIDWKLYYWKLHNYIDCKLLYSPYKLSQSSFLCESTQAENATLPLAGHTFSALRRRLGVEASLEL